jgi:hypothetical protein
MRRICLLVLFLFSGAGAIFHQNSRGTQVHTPFRWVFADSAAREAQSVTAGDTDNIAYQVSDSSLWVLRDNSPKLWVRASQRTNSGSFACTLHTFGGSYLTYSDTIGTVVWAKQGVLFFARMVGFNVRSIGGGLYTRSFPDSLMPDTTNENRYPIVPFGNCASTGSLGQGRGHRIEFNYPLELGAGSGHNVFFAGDTVYLRGQEFNYLILR